MPAGLLVTVPEPVPLLVTVSACVVVAVKPAVTVWDAFMLTVHAPVPEQPAPLQPVKVEPLAGVAVSVTLVPLLKFPLQVAPQVIPAGLEVTEPEPVPVSVTVSG